MSEFVATESDQTNLNLTGLSTINLAKIFAEEFQELEDGRESRF